MARCRKQHDFGSWKPYQYSSCLSWQEMTEEDIKRRQKKYDEEKKKYEGTKYYYFGKIHWERRCKKCNKKDQEWLNPYDRPESKEIKIKKTSGPKMKKRKEEKHGRKLEGKETSMSKGWKHW